MSQKLYSRHVNVSLPGASTPQQPWCYSPQSHVLPPLPLQTIFGHRICSFVQFYARFQ